MTGISARNELVTRNTGYVNLVANRYSNICADPDLRQQAYLGLLEAATVFDPERFTTRFLTIAHHYVKKYIMLYLSNRGLIRVPPVTQRTARRATGELDDRARAAAMAMRKPVYLGAFPNDGDAILGVEPDNDSPRAPGGEHDCKRLLAAIDQLSSFEADVIKSGYGIGCKKEMIKATARRFNMHPQKIVRTRFGAIIKLRRLLSATPC